MQATNAKDVLTAFLEILPVANLVVHAGAAPMLTHRFQATATTALAAACAAKGIQVAGTASNAWTATLETRPLGTADLVTAA